MIDLSRRDVLRSMAGLGVVTGASKPKEAMLWAETEIKRAFERG